jgi:hypothetical protein
LPAHNNQRRQKKKRKIQRTSETIEKSRRRYSGERGGQDDKRDKEM